MTDRRDTPYFKAGVLQHLRGPRYTKPSLADPKRGPQAFHVCPLVASYEYQYRLIIRQEDERLHDAALWGRHGPRSRLGGAGVSR
jgi:hypothetical protein